MHPKRLNKTKLQNVYIVAILTLCLFQLKLLIYAQGSKYKFSKISTLQQLISLKVLSKRIMFHFNFYCKHFNYKNQSKNIQTRKGNYVLIRIGQTLVKYQLNFTKAKNGNQYLTNKIVKYQLNLTKILLIILVSKMYSQYWLNISKKVEISVNQYLAGILYTTRHIVTRKRNSKRLKQTGNHFTKNLQLIGVS